MILVFIVSLVIYGSTMAHVVTAEDSGELATAAYYLGIPHPPGFPLWCILAKCFTWLPFGSIVARITLFSAICCALTGALVCLFVYRLQHSCLAGMAAGLICLFGKTLWSHATVMEVYPLNALFIAIILLLVQTWLRNSRDTLLMWIAFLSALGLSNHLMLGFLLIVVGLILFFHKPAIIKRPGFLLVLLLLFGVGLIPYLYLPIRASAQPVINWGRPVTLQAFFSHITRSQYTHTWGSSDFTFSSLILFLKDFFKELPDQYGFIILAIAGLGLFVLFHQERKIGLLTVSFAIVSVIGPLLVGQYPSTSENFSIAQAWYHPAYIIIAIWTGAAYAWIFTQIRYIKQKLLTVTITIILLLLALYPLYKNYYECDKSSYYLARDHALNIFDSVETDAIYFPAGDYSDFPAFYLQAVEGIRPDVVIASYSGTFSERFLDLVRQAASIQKDHELLEAISKYYNLPNLPIGKQNTAEITKWEQKIISGASELLDRPIYYYSKSHALLPGPESRLLPHGIVFKVYTAQEQINPHQNIPESLWATFEQRYANSKKTHLDYFGRMIMFDWNLARLIKYLSDDNIESAVSLINECKKYAGTNEACYNNLGSCLAEHGLFQHAYPILQQAILLRPDYTMAIKNMAMLCQKTKRYDEAIKYWQNLVRAGREYHGQASKQVSRLKALVVKLDADINECTALLHENPENAATHNNIGTAYAARGWGEKAIQEYEKALQLDPNYAMVYRNLIRLYSEQLPDPQKVQEYRLQLKRITQNQVDSDEQPQR
jgi:tetratricopeptide (TPR) repeat protein